ncbi:MAG TPA: DUF418 domain-containing protein [Actinoplanes sp.]
MTEAVLQKTGYQRALAPDLLRGSMLLFIALANAANFAFAGQPGLDGTPHGPQRVVNLLMSLFVNSRAYPVFAIMFGYGLVQMARRHEKKALLRRNIALVGFGLVHATLLYFGDFLGAYGIVGVICTLLLLRRSDRFHRLILWLWGLQTVDAIVLAAVTLHKARSGTAVLTNHPDASLGASGYRASLIDRLHEWPVHTATVIPFIVIVWLGIWAARRRLLEEPASHRTLLRRAAIAGFAISIAGGLPYALVSAGWLHVDAGSVQLMSLLHDVTGEYGGVGYVALFGLLAIRLRATSRLVAPVVALGQRSLSGYLFQSVAWLALFSSWALDLGGSTWWALFAAIAVWTVSCLAANRMSAAGYRGPAEIVLRKIAYRGAA